MLLPRSVVASRITGSSWIDALWNVTTCLHNVAFVTLALYYDLGWFAHRPCFDPGPLRKEVQERIRSSGASV